MTHTITRDGREIAIELHRLLRELDPARWRVELEQGARARAAYILELIRASRAAHLLEGRWASLRGGFAEVAASLEAHLPAGHLSQGEARAAWQRVRTQLAPAYERLASSLREHAIHVPSLRPTNYARNLFHAGGAVLALALLLALSQGAQLIVALSCAGWAWSMELLRRRIPRLNAILMRIFGRLAHPHEAWRVNSSTWFATALVALAAIGEPAVSASALLILGFADPAAALVGRRFGTIKLVHGRSLQGSLAFLVVGFVAAAGVLIGIGALPARPAMWVALAAAAPATIVELFSRTVDDNLSIPLAAAAGAWLALAALG